MLSYLACFKAPSIYTQFDAMCISYLYNFLLCKCSLEVVSCCYFLSDSFCTSSLIFHDGYSYGTTKQTHLLLNIAYLIMFPLNQRLNDNSFIPASIPAFQHTSIQTSIEYYSTTYLLKSIFTDIVENKTIKEVHIKNHILVN